MMESRNRDIYRRRERGDTFRAIGSQYGLSPGRTREIYLAEGRRIRAAEAAVPDLTVRAFNIICKIAADEGWQGQRQYTDPHDICGYLDKMKALLRDKRLTMKGGLLHYGNRPITNCGKKCSAEVWAALGEATVNNNSHLLTSLRVDIAKIRLGRDAAAEFTKDREPPENGILNIELLEEAARYLESLEGAAGDQLCRQEFARVLVEWSEGG